MPYNTVWYNTFSIKKNIFVSNKKYVSLHNQKQKVKTMKTIESKHENVEQKYKKLKREVVILRIFACLVVFVQLYNLIHAKFF